MKSGTWIQVKLRWVFKRTLDLHSGTGQSRSLLERGFFEATHRCLGGYGPYRFKTAKEQSSKGGSSKVNYDALENDESKAFLEAKSPSVMKKVGEFLPPRGIELKRVTIMGLRSISGIENSFKGECAISCSDYKHLFYIDMSTGCLIPGLETNGLFFPATIIGSCAGLWAMTTIILQVI